MAARMFLALDVQVYFNEGKNVALIQLNLKGSSVTFKEKEIRNFIFPHRSLLCALALFQFLFLRYYLEIRSHSLSLPGCRHSCTKEIQQPECCQGYWGPDCMGKLFSDRIWVEIKNCFFLLSLPQELCFSEFTTGSEINSGVYPKIGGFGGKKPNTHI